MCLNENIIVHHQPISFFTSKSWLTLNRLISYLQKLSSYFSLLEYDKTFSQLGGESEIALSKNSKLGGGGEYSV